ncbi:hypothetical protein Q8F55_005187 [Vanrija albida]|uniref:Uncharacterized protein n=1 Tax=Vanrija albida TaxID=181172 RepID=A0ABR3Q0X2_9TREE
MASAGTTPPPAAWAPPPELTPTAVLPDFRTAPSALASLPGAESDPGRMGIFLCLLDDRPHLHPSLAALNAHRARVHSLPAPADGALPPGAGVEWTAWRLSEDEEARRAAYLPLP